MGKKKYRDEDEVQPLRQEVTITALAMKIPKIIKYFDTSMVKQAQLKPDWKLYRIEIREGVPYIVREMCDRCGKVKIPKRWRKLRVYDDPDVGEIYLETGICKDCINASVYVDKYLDGIALTEKEAKQQFYEYAGEYERAWRLVLATAPRIMMTEAEWQHRCKFFEGCAMCGGPIEVKAKYFPTYLNGAHTSWNIVPLCKDCLDKHYKGRVTARRKVYRYKVFSTHEQFQKSKTIRMYLLAQMEKHNLYMEPLEPYRRRFFELKTLKGAD